MKMKLFTSVAFAALLIPGAAFAQSTGSVDFEKGGEDIVVTARTTKGIEGIQSPDTSKAKGVLTQEFIAKQTPGNSIRSVRPAARSPFVVSTRRASR